MMKWFWWQYSEPQKSRSFFKAALSFLCLGLSFFSSCSSVVCLLQWILLVFSDVLSNVNTEPAGGPHSHSLLCIPCLSCRQRCHLPGEALSCLCSAPSVHPKTQSGTPTCWNFHLGGRWFGVNTAFYCPQGLLCCPLLWGDFCSTCCCCPKAKHSWLKMPFQDRHFQRVFFSICFLHCLLIVTIKRCWMLSPKP